MLYDTKNPHGGDIYAGNVRLDFSANTNPFGTPESVLAAITRALPEVHRYPDPYCRALRAAIAAAEGVPEEYILCGSGAAELIYAFADAVRPRCAAELASTFAEYSLALARTGCAVARYTLSEKNDFAPDGGILDFLRETRPEVFFLCNPNNPTGRLADGALLAEDGTVAIRTRDRKEMPDDFGVLHKVRLKRYGSSTVHFYERVDEEPQGEPETASEDAQVDGDPAAQERSQDA